MVREPGGSGWLRVNTRVVSGTVWFDDEATIELPMINHRSILRASIGSNGQLVSFFIEGQPMGGCGPRGSVSVLSCGGVQGHFLAAAAVALARFNLSISRRSEATHRERTAPISKSFLRSMAASAAPSRSLAEGRGGRYHDDQRGHVLPVLILSQH